MATRIAAVSRAVAEEAVRWFGVARERIEIVPNGVDDFFSPATDEQESDYVLYVGTIEPRKGLDDLLAVWDSLPAPRLRLVLCGDAGWGNIALPRGAEVTGYVDRAKLRELYRGARAFVYPSRYEGFGIPPLEAMACGASVIATRTGAIPEYAEGAALLIDPGDRNALRSSLLRLLGDPTLRDELRSRGTERAGAYTWERSAALMTQLIAEAAR
jgi:glycosyltransferase involved in cell wall biosynthesis